uniref:Uncharacterized protein n=1 Tax=Oryza nivara TaxID=4536 RepID=A0A0E0I0Y7_ORYNI
MRLQKIEEMRRREKRCCSCKRESSILEERRVAAPAEERSAQKRKHFDELAAREEIEVISVNVVYLKLTCPYFQRGMYQMSINESAQPQGPSFFLEMLGQGDCLLSQPPIMQPQTTGPSQLDDPLPITQPTQDYGHVDFSGVEVACRFVRERHSPERLSLSGRRSLAGARRKGKKKDTTTSTNFDDEVNE